MTTHFPATSSVTWSELTIVQPESEPLAREYVMVPDPLETVADSVTRVPTVALDGTMSEMVRDPGFTVSVRFADAEVVPS